MCLKTQFESCFSDRDSVGATAPRLALFREWSFVLVHTAISQLSAAGQLTTDQLLEANVSSKHRFRL